MHRLPSQYMSSLLSLADDCGPPAEGKPHPSGEGQAGSNLQACYVSERSGLPRQMPSPPLPVMCTPQPVTSAWRLLLDGADGADVPTSLVACTNLRSREPGPERRSGEAREPCGSRPQGRPRQRRPWRGARRTRTRMPHRVGQRAATSVRRHSGPGQQGPPGAFVVALSF